MEWLVFPAYPLSPLAEIKIDMGLLGEAAVAPERARSKPIEEAYPVYGIQVPLAEGRVAIGQGDYDKAFNVSVPDLRKPFLDQPEVEAVLNSGKLKTHLAKPTDSFL